MRAQAYASAGESSHSSRFGEHSPPRPVGADQQLAQNNLPASSEHKETAVAADDPYAFLGDFDTVFLIDDSSSMHGESWNQTQSALESIVPICTAHDTDGIDIYFLNKQDSLTYRNVTSLEGVNITFGQVSPSGMTPTGKRLNDIMEPYINKLERPGGAAQSKLKPLNIIVITDGAPNSPSDLESTIVSAAKRLDALEAPAWQIGIQFFQVGGDRSATKSLAELDDSLKEKHHIRDMVDTVPWKAESGLDGMFILKVVTGAVNRRLDRRAV